MKMGFGIVVAIQLSSGKIWYQCSIKRTGSHAITALTMNVIDLEILIPASPEFIWRFLGDPAALPQWQADVTSISFLSTQREGRGTRWRAYSDNNNDIVVEVSAWYDTLGYEYGLMDGTGFADNKGRIRLQEVPEGTIVRWTFQYELGGVLGGLRNAMRLKRSTTNQLQTSLRNLHQLILQESGGITTHEAKASVREAPDVSERLTYQPRHPSAFHDPALDEQAEGDTELATDKQPVSYVFDFDSDPIPTLTDTDTKPNPVVLSASNEEDIQVEKVVELDDTKPIDVETLFAEPPTASPDPQIATPVLEPILSESPPEAPLEHQASLPKFLALDEKRDTAHLSVFEIFGLQKPSEARTRSETPRDTFRDRGSFSEAPARQIEREAAASDELLDFRPQTTAADSPNKIVTGWRRQSRRRTTVLRSHR